MPELARSLSFNYLDCTMLLLSCATSRLLPDRIHASGNVYKTMAQSTHKSQLMCSQEGGVFAIANKAREHAA
jgi:hypothetical protein